MPPGTHTQKAGTGGGPGVQQVRAGLPRPWRANPGAKCAAPAPHPPWPPCPHPQPAGQPCPGLEGGFSSAFGTRAALSDQRDSQRRAAVATAPEGLADLRPRGSRCWSPTRGPAHRRRSIPVCRSSPLLNKGCPPPHYPPERWALQRGRYGWVPGYGTLAHTRLCLSQSETHTPTLAGTHGPQSHSPPSPLSSPRSPTAQAAAISLLSVSTEEGGGQQPDLGRPGSAVRPGRCPLFPAWSREPPGSEPRSHRRRAATAAAQRRVSISSGLSQARDAHKGRDGGNRVTGAERENDIEKGNRENQKGKKGERGAGGERR